MKKFSFSLFFLASFLPLSVLAYPGCSSPDITLGGQMWASCNALTKNMGSSLRSGWFFAGEVFPRLISENGIGKSFSIERKTSRKNMSLGPCASGYRLPTRGDWETAITSARLNGVSLASLLSLPYNGGYHTDGDTKNLVIVRDMNILGAYWSSTLEDIWGVRPIVLHLSDLLQNRYRMDATVGGYSASVQIPESTEEGFELITHIDREVANVRCIRK